MIRKILKIKNVGKFRSYSAKGDIEFNKLNIIYSENGRGKTTLSTILRSLKTNQPNLIRGRKTLGEAEDQEVDILFDDCKLTYKNNIWQSTCPIEFEIFDSVFVTKNVFSGNYVEHEHKKSLYMFTLGEQGVNMAKEIEEIDAELKIKNASLKKQEEEISKYVIGNMSIDTFLKLKPLDGIVNKIKQQEELVNSLKYAEEIKNKNLLSTICLPVLEIKEIENALIKSLEHVAENADKLTKDHIRKCLGSKGEKWIEYGFNYIVDNQCPFCGQSVKSVTLVDAYKAYFSIEYNNLKQEINEYFDSKLKELSQSKLFIIQEIINNNIRLVDFWIHHINSTDIVELDFSELQTSLTELEKVFSDLVSQKKENLLDSIKISHEFIECNNNYLFILKKADSYNEFIKNFNGKIQTLKNGIDIIDLKSNINKLDEYLNINIRYKEDVVNTIRQYNSELGVVKILKTKKETLRESMKSYTEVLFKKYEKSINKHLENFGAGFRIISYTSSFLGGKPSTNYKIQINNISIDIGSPDASDEVPSFKNTLSEGDKNSLAFALFLSKLEQDNALESKIIVFDDPITSLDNHRKNYTVHQILRLCNLSNQVFVLTHDSYFARIIWQQYTEKNLLKELCITRESKDFSIIDNWNIEKATQGEYFQYYTRLAEYLDNPNDCDKLSVAQCIRPLLEGNLRMRFPKEFKANEWLGDFIKRIRLAVDSSPLICMKEILDELEGINNYSKRYHHENPNYLSEPIYDNELQVYIKRTLSVMSGILKPND